MLTGNLQLQHYHNAPPQAATAVTHQQQKHSLKTLH
jgi:hypothetical protein